MAKSRGLTAKQLEFVREYLRNGGNATNAALKAGYSKTNAASIGCQLLKKPQVRAHLEQKIERIEQRSEVDVARILLELQRIALVDIKDLFDSEGRPLALDKMPEDARRAISAMEVDEIWGKADDGEGNEGKAVIGQTKKLKLASKLEALKLLGQTKKLFTEVHEHRGSLLDLLTGTAA